MLITTKTQKIHSRFKIRNTKYEIQLSNFAIQNLNWSNYTFEPLYSSDTKLFLRVDFNAVFFVCNHSRFSSFLQHFYLFLILRSNQSTNACDIIHTPYLSLLKLKNSKNTKKKQLKWHWENPRYPKIGTWGSEEPREILWLALRVLRKLLKNPEVGIEGNDVLRNPE